MEESLARKVKDFARILVVKYGAKLILLPYKTIKLDALRMNIPPGAFLDVFRMALRMVGESKEETIMSRASKLLSKMKPATEEKKIEFKCEGKDCEFVSEEKVEKCPKCGSEKFIEKEVVEDE